MRETSKGFKGYLRRDPHWMPIAWNERIDSSFCSSLVNKPPIVTYRFHTISKKRTKVTRMNLHRHIQSLLSTCENEKESLLYHIKKCEERQEDGELSLEINKTSHRIQNRTRIIKLLREASMILEGEEGRVHSFKSCEWGYVEDVTGVKRGSCPPSRTTTSQSESQSSGSPSESERERPSSNQELQHLSSQVHQVQHTLDIKTLQGRQALTNTILLYVLKQHPNLKIFTDRTFEISRQVGGINKGLVGEMDVVGRQFDARILVGNEDGAVQLAVLYAWLKGRGEARGEGLKGEGLKGEEGRVMKERGEGLKGEEGRVYGLMVSKDGWTSMTITQGTIHTLQRIRVTKGYSQYEIIKVLRLVEHVVSEAYPS